MRVVVTGSRGWRDEDAIHGRLSRFPEGTVIVHGGAKGADQIANEAAFLFGFQVEAHPAEWQLHGKRAGIIRTLEMLDTNPDLVLAFWDGMSHGTKHCIDAAFERGIPVEVITP